MPSVKPKAPNGLPLLNSLSKELFLKNISEARKTNGKSVENFPFNKSRCQVLTINDEVKENSSGVVYWMYRDCRVQDNWALLFAQRLALKHKLPLFVCVLTKEFNSLYPTIRHLNFALEGFKIVQNECKRKNIGFYFLNSDTSDFVKIIKENNVGAVVCDYSPLKKPMEWKEHLKNHLEKDVPLVEVDAHNVIPVWLASDKQEIMAKTIRPKINKHLPEFLTGFPDVCEHKYSGKIKTKQQFDEIENVHEFYKPLHNVKEVEWAKAGEEHGLEMLLSFMKERLKYYGVDSNDPSKNHTSNLSPWLHFGHISAQRVAIEVKSIETLYKEQVDKFLEELIVRKELAENYCHYNKNYDNICGAADWAKKTLLEHKKDKREYVYTKDQFEKALTHDDIWNVAQLQLLQEGKIHGYMRMYWCKKILEWTESPEKAIEIGLWLNDTFSLDGTDPNGFVGIMWSICCVHDQGWGERPIFGKIRYMVDYSLKRKFDIEAYCARYGRKLKKTDAKKGTKRKLK